MIGQLISDKLGWDKFNKFVKEEVSLSYDKDLIDIVDPYLRIDVSLALENGQKDIAFEMVNNAIQKTFQLRKNIGHGFVEYMGIVPQQFRDIRGKYLEGDRYSFGYEREWAVYEHAHDNTIVVEFTWHRHDGQGREAGTVELWVTEIDSRVFVLDN